MARVITSPHDAIQHPLKNFTYKHIVRLRDDAIYSFGCFLFNFIKASSAVNYLFVHTDDGGVEALLDYCCPCKRTQCLVSLNFNLNLMSKLEYCIYTNIVVKCIK